MNSILTEGEVLGAWSLADEMLLQLEIDRAEPLSAADFAQLAADVTQATASPEDVRKSAIALGVASMRIALGERFMADGQKQSAT